MTSRLRHPHTRVRWRLTLLYGGLFLVCGAALLAVTYALVARATVDAGGTFRAVQPNASPPKNVFIRKVPPDAPAQLKRVLSSPGGRAAARFVVAQQRVADLHQLEIESGIALGIMAIISGLLGWVIAGRVLRPLHSAYDAQRRFVANASHELRTPLTTVRALLEMVTSDPRATVRTYRRTCQQALDENAQQEQLIDALLALAQGQQGLPEREPVDLGLVAAEVLRAHEADAAAEQLELEVAIEPAMFAGDRRLVSRLVTNLILNAIRHNVPHGHVVVRVDGRAGRASFTVANTGPLVPAAEIERLLQPFQRMGAERQVHQDGSGLGLSIVAAIADAHGAALEIRPREDGGLEVEVRFPAARSPAFATTAAALPPGSPRQPQWHRLAAAGEDYGGEAHERRVQGAQPV